MKNKPLLLWGLGAGIIALVAFIVGYAFVWPVDDDGHECGLRNSGRHDMMDGRRGMMDEDGGCGLSGIMDDMMDGGGFGGMMSGGIGGMMSGPVDAASAPITIDQAADAATRYLSDQGDNDLKVTRILEFTNGFYARVTEQGSGTGAYELWIDRNDGDVGRAMGSGMIWNQKYRGGIDAMKAMMDDGGITGCLKYGDMMGASSVDDRATTTEMTISVDDARSRAQQFAELQYPGSTAVGPDVFYGYYTVDIVKEGRVLAMLSVNGYSGQVWLHFLNGAYLGGKTL